MAKTVLTEAMAEAAVYGGAILGGGGGGWIEDGLRSARLAIDAGDPVLVDINEIAPDGFLVIAGLVGAPAAKDRYVKPADYLKTLQLLLRHADCRVAGIITNENGATATVNGWFQAALSGLPVVDAPCNGRAHPTALMGSMGLHRQSDFVSRQAAIGGRPGRHVELYVETTIEAGAALVRQASIQAGGLVAVARNPVEGTYARENAACGAITAAIRTGQRYLALREKGGGAVVAGMAEYLGGRVLAEGEVAAFSLETAGGFDVGTARVAGVEMTFWNEYMTVEQAGQRLATFPDLIMTFELATGRPLTSAEMAKGLAVGVIAVPSSRLILGSGMRCRELFEKVEEVISKPVIDYIFRER